MPRQKPRDYAALGRKGGKVGGRSRSAAKIAAVRENGKLGGRPRKKHAKKAKD
jgi:general stress protein YciG